MLNLLAEASPEGLTWIQGAIIGLPTIASAVTAWFVITGKGRTPQPLRVQGETRLATREELDDVAQAVDKVELDLKDARGEIHAMEHRLSADLETRVVAIHRRLDVMQVDVASVPARTVALIKDAKGLIS